MIFKKLSGHEKHSTRSSSNCYPTSDKGLDNSCLKYHKPSPNISAPLPLANLDDEGLFDIGKILS